MATLEFELTKIEDLEKSWPVTEIQFRAVNLSKEAMTLDLTVDTSQVDGKAIPSTFDVAQRGADAGETVSLEIAPLSECRDAVYVRLSRENFRGIRGLEFDIHLVVACQGEALEDRMLRTRVAF